MKNFLKVLIFFYSVNCFGQTDTVKTTDSNNLFGGVRYSDYDDNNKKTALKISFTDLLAGKYGLYAEHKVSKGFAVELGAGITRKNLLYNKLRSTLFDNKDNQESTFFINEYDIKDEDFEFDSRDVKTGFFVSLMPKYCYWKEEGLHGPYLGANLQYRKYKSVAYGQISTSINPGEVSFQSGPNNIDEYESYFIYAAMWGYKRMPKKVLIETALSLGVINIKGEKRDAGFIDPSTYQVAVSPTKRSIDHSTIYLEIAFKIGFGL